MKKKILCVDNEEHVLKLLKLCLNDYYDLTCVKSAKEALIELRKTEFDLMTIEIMLIGVNGYELCRTSKEKYPSLPILFISNKCQMNDKLHAIDVGGTDYLTKPFDPAKLIIRVKNSIRR